MSSRQLFALALSLSCLASCRSLGGKPEPLSAFLRTDSTEVSVQFRDNAYVAKIGFLFINNTGKPISRASCGGPGWPGVEKKVDGRWVTAVHSFELACRMIPDFFWENGATYRAVLDFGAYEPGHRHMPELLVDSINGAYRLHWFFSEGREAGAKGARTVEAISNEFRMVLRSPATSPSARPTPPTRDPNTPGFVSAKELPDGAVPRPDMDGNFIIGPTHTPAPEMFLLDGAPRGTIHTFTMSSADSKIFPGIARDSGTFGSPSPTDPATLIVTTSHPAPYTRKVSVYVPAQYVPGTVAPFIVGADGPDPLLFTTLDNLIAQKRVPVMIAISIGNGGGDAQGSERGLEYDTMSGRYAEFVETEVLPLVERQYNVKLTKNPDRRATMGGSSGGSAAFIMAWYHPELYHRVLAYSITAINQQWPHSAETPHGAWELHERLIPNSPAKPIRVWLGVGDRDLLNPNVMRDDMHDWVVASERMASVLAARGYHYQFVFGRNAGHTDRSMKQQTLPAALEWLWKH